MDSFQKIPIEKLSFSMSGPKMIRVVTLICTETGGGGSGRGIRAGDPGAEQCSLYYKVGKKSDACSESPSSGPGMSTIFSVWQSLVCLWDYFCLILVSKNCKFQNPHDQGG